MSLALLVMVGTTALTTRQEPPPAVAEVAPDAAAPSNRGPAPISGPRPPRQEQEPVREAALSSPTRPAGGAAGRASSRVAITGGAGSRGPTRGVTGGDGTGDGSGGDAAGGDLVGADTGTAPPQGAGVAPVEERESPPAAPEATTTTIAQSTTTTASPSTTTTTIAMASAPCFDDQRQIEDAQSPPCRRTGPKYSPDAPRAKGVTADGRIIIAYPETTQLGGGNNTTGINNIWLGLEDYFNAHFMFYDRKIDLVPYKPRNLSGPGSTPAAAIADADAVNELGAFAALGYLYDNAGNAFEDRLAQHGIISAKGSAAPVDEDHYQRPGIHPFQWSYTPTVAQMQLSEAAWICSQLYDKAPEHAGKTETGDLSIHSTFQENDVATRKFGLIVNQFPDARIDTTAFEKRLKDNCGIVIPEAAKVASLYKGELSATPESAAAVLRLVSQKVTTVICLCHVNAMRQTFQTAADDQAYRPEWLVTTFLHNDYQSALNNNAPKRGAPGMYTSGLAAQMEHSFGLSFRPKTVRFDELPITKALAERYGRWTWDEINGVGVNNGTQKEWSAQMYNWQYFKPLLLLAAGIQQAGPDLSPARFAGDGGDYPGLQGTDFPNPETSDYAGRVGFDGDHSMVDDATVIWWSNTEPSNWGNTSYQGERDVPGTWCYADKGRRYSFSQWAGSTSGLFTGSCY